ncbi:hypothetical protein [Gemmobacter lutimaris]|uniref:hypothetical protein n=1 Tax=Gemmobacter lutimaris TaxID=2306023 RepID=UPI0013146CE8|nr:hypothetical protein [Gemmobacter lutimaris]
MRSDDVGISPFNDWRISSITSGSGLGSAKGPGTFAFIWTSGVAAVCAGHPG